MMMMGQNQPGWRVTRLSVSSETASHVLAQTVIRPAVAYLTDYCHFWQVTQLGQGGVASDAVSLS
jgi:hypothetical protein